MPEPSIGESFRRLGQDISGAMTAPIEARLRALQIKRGLEKEEEQAASLRRYSEEIAKTDPAAGEAAKLGQLDEYIRFKQYQEENEYADFGQFFSIAESNDRNNTAQNMKTSENVVSNMDDLTKLDASMDSANANFNARNKMADFALRLDNLIDKSYFTQTASEGEAIFKMSKPDKKLIPQVRGAMLSEIRGKLDNSIASELEDPEKTYGFDLRGIPKWHRVKAYAAALISKGELAESDATEVFNTESLKDLYRISGDEDESRGKRKVAGAIAKDYLSYEIATDATEKPKWLTQDGVIYPLNRRTGKFEKGIEPEEVAVEKAEKKAEETRKEQEKILRDLKAAYEKRKKEIQTELSKSTNTILRNDPPKIELQKLENRANIYVNRGERVPEIEINKLGNFIEERAATFGAKTGKVLGEFLTTEGETQINKAQSLMEFIIQYNDAKGAGPEAGVRETEPVFQPAFQIPPPTGTKDQIKRSSADKLIRDGKVTEEQLRETYDIVP